MKARATTPFAAATARCASPIPQPRDPLFATLIEAAGQVGIRHNPDYNGASQDGIAMSQATIASRPPHEHGALLPRSGPQAAATCTSRPAR